MEIINEATNKDVSVNVEKYYFAISPEEVGLKRSHWQILLEGFCFALGFYHTMQFYHSYKFFKGMHGDSSGWLSASEEYLLYYNIFSNIALTLYTYRVATLSLQKKSKVLTEFLVLLGASFLQLAIYGFWSAIINTYSETAIIGYVLFLVLYQIIIGAFGFALTRSKRAKATFIN